MDHIKDKLAARSMLAIYWVSWYVDL